MAGDTSRAIRRHAQRIGAISGERIFDEMCKMLSLASAHKALRRLGRLSLAGAIVPELMAGRGVWTRALRLVSAIAGRKDLLLTLAALLCELPPRTIRRIVRRWGGANDLSGSLIWLAEHCDDWREPGGISLADLKRLAGHKDFARLRWLWAAKERMRTGQGANSKTIVRRAGALAPDSISPPALLCGRDLLAMGVEAGPEFGRVLDSVYEAQLNERITTRAEAVTMARELLRLP
jgi:poly(A) polymerase